VRPDGRLAGAPRLAVRLPSVAGNILVALFYAIFLYSAFRFWLKTGSLVGLGVVAFNTLVILFLLTRRRPTMVTGSIRNWILAPMTQILPLLLRPVESASWPLFVASSLGQLAGLAVMGASLAVLSRSIGVVAANRGIKTRGPYAWVRHPLYAGEILFFLAFLAGNFTRPNALLICLLILAQITRAHQEEAILGRDDKYAAYRTAVAYRLIPGVF